MYPIKGPYLYVAALLTTCNKDNQNSLDEILNNVLHLVKGDMTSVRYMQMEPLGKRREKAD